MKEWQNTEKMQNLFIWVKYLSYCQFFQCYHQQHAFSLSKSESCYIIRDDDAAVNRFITLFHQAPAAADDCSSIMQSSWFQWLTHSFQLISSTDKLCWPHQDSPPAITHQEVLHNVMLPPFNPVLTPLKSIALHDVLMSNHVVCTPFSQNCVVI